MTEDHLREYFSQFGSVASVDITKDRNTGQRRGFGFVTFDDYDPVDKVICNQLQSSNIYNFTFCIFCFNYYLGSCQLRALE